MAIEREQIGPASKYEGHNITAHKMSVDVLIRVDGSDFGMYLTAEAGRVAAMNFIDAENKRDRRENR